MKASTLFQKTQFLLRPIQLVLFLSFASFLWATPDFSTDPSAVVFSNIRGTIWIEFDDNAMYNGESGPSGVQISLFNSDEDTIVAQTFSLSGSYEFANIPEGKYYLRIDNSAFTFGGPLSGLQSCPGTNDANDMIDNDDNGSDTTPNDVLSSPFNLVDNDPMNTVIINYIDFCFSSNCDEANPFAVGSCEEILPENVFCEISAFDNLCAVMPSEPSPGTQPETLCDGFNTPENISWLAFVAPDGNYSINVTPLNCETIGIGEKGLQVGIYTDCSFSESVFCSACTEDLISIGASVLNPGQIYYMYINGCTGNVCSYRIEINGNTTEPSLEPEDVCIFSDGDFQCEDISYCTNDDIIFQGKGIAETGNFTWSVTTVSGTPYLGDSIIMTNVNTLALNMPGEGTYSICLTNVENGCSSQDWSGAICREVTTSFAIPMPTDEDFGVFSVCESQLDLFTLNFLEPFDPNNDGDFGWNASNVDFALGLNQATVSTEGCSYEQEFELSTFPSSPVGMYEITICEEDFPIQIDAIEITETSFAGTQNFVLENYLLLTESDQNGCDSIINIEIEKLSVSTGFLTNSSCTMEGVIMDFDYLPSLSTDISFLNFEWRDPFGNILPTGLDQLSNIAPYESGSGEYTLDVTIDKNGTTCTYSYSTFVNIADYVPAPPIVSGPQIVCNGEGSSVYTAQGDSDEFTFIWSFPNDVTSAVISGTTDEILTVDWTGSSGGDIVVIGQNGCAQSDQVSLNVQVIPLPTPDFSIDTSVCVDNVATIEYIGSSVNIANYSWDFGDGSIISGSGTGPYEIVWDTPGEKQVSLITTDNNGCVSAPVVKTIPVQSPLTPTAVTCNSSLGEVVFTWEIPFMVSGFEVNVLTGQTGGVFTANSYTISGLSEGEVVTIELLTIPDDPICGEFVSTTVTCTASDCTTPEIVLGADQDLCVDDINILITAEIITGETGTGIFSGPGITDAENGIFDPSVADIGINTILYTFTSDAAGCTGSSAINIEVFDLPTAAFVQDVDVMCVTDVVNLVYDGTPDADVYDWDFEDGVSSGSDINQSVSFETPGLKIIQLQVTKNGCVSEVFSTTLLVEPEIEEVVIQCDSASTDFVTFSWNAVAGVTLFQIKIDDDIPFITDDTFITIDNLNEEQEVGITVTPFQNSSCPSSSSTAMCTTTMAPVSVADSKISKIKIFPNPVKDLLFFDGITDRSMSFEVHSILGETLMRGSSIAVPLDLSSLPSGLYIVKVIDTQAKLSRDFKIVKE